MQRSNLQAMRHSCSHVMAVAVLKLFPKAKLAIGPAIEDGFYYDFDLPKPISEKDLTKISSSMNRITGLKQPFEKKLVSLKEAKRVFQEQPYKLELIDELAKEGNKEVSLYQSGDFIDLCQGPHVEDTSKIGPFKLLSIAGAYCHGDEKNKMLTRIYGTCFPIKKELDHYLWQQEETKKRDHRKLGKELGLFIIPEEVGPGLLIWTPKGAIIRREIEKFIIEEQTE
ncbi:threonine--tRNA ligase, partial [Candidatus Gottesmanbacteria bacterium]|nr:threonine--tRNA ligase [Candidatus Gottesmanbacteria bacterium]